MRRALLLALVLALGCAKPPAPSPGANAASAPAPAAATEPVSNVEPVSTAEPAAPREADAQLADALDAAAASIEKAQAKAKALAPRAGGEAGQALSEVADGLDAAGEALADHTDPPPAGRALTDAERKAAVQAAADALGELRDAGDILDGLAQNAPKEHEAALEAIRSAVDEAQGSIETAMEELGAKAPEPENPPPGG